MNPAKLGLYLTYAVRSLVRGGQRTLLAMLCVAIGVMAIVALQLVGNSVSNSLTGNVRALNGGDLAINGVNLNATQLRYFDQLQAQGAITAYATDSSNQGSAQSPHPVSRFDIRLVDPARYPLAGAPVFEAPQDGQLSAILDSSTSVLTQSLARQMNAHVGDRFTVTLADGHAATVTVGGIVENGGLFQPPLLLMSYTARATFGESTAQPLLYNAVYADVPGHSAQRAAVVEQGILGQFPSAEVVTAANLLQNNQQEVDGIRSFLRIIGLVALLIGGMGIVNTMQVLLRRRTTEIAMLKAGGYKPRDLFALFGLEAGLLGLIGGAIGAAAGIGVSFVVNGYAERALSLVLPLTVDPPIVGSGVAVGVATALIFGLLPIVRASQTRPIAALREAPEGARVVSRASTVLLTLLVVGFCYLLALAILRDAALALGLVAAAAVVLGLLYLLFALADGIISRLPVPGSFRGKTTITLALRNLGRQRGRTVTTQSALFVGVFAVGLILVLGQGLQTQYSHGGNGVNAIVWTANPAQVEQRLQQSGAVTRNDVYRSTSFTPLAINGNDVTAAVASHRYDMDGLSPLAGMLGFDLAHGYTPTAPDYTLVAGRMLGAGDAGSHNVVVDQLTRTAPLSLKLGDRLTVRYLSKNTFSTGSTASDSPSGTFTVVGFYQNNTGVPSLESTLLADFGAVDEVGGSNVLYMLGIHVDPQRADAVLTGLQAALPGQVFVHSYVESFAQEETYLSNLILMLEAIVLPALIAAFINIANAVALAMLDRRREVGILKAVGHTSRSVLTDVVLEQGVAALVASLLAVLCAVGLAVLLGAVPNKGGAPIPSNISAQSVTAVIAASVLLGMLVTAVVAWNASHRRPLWALRYE
jgi:putative ABC transport system permease protein